MDQKIDIYTLDLIVNGEWFDHHFLLNFIPKRKDLRIYLNKKNYQFTEDKLSSRVLNHWYEKGIIEDDRPNGKGWKKYSISELTWINIVKRLRSFGMDLNSILKVHQYLKKYNIKGTESKYCILDFYISYGLLFREPIKLIVLHNGTATLCTQEALSSFEQSGLLDFAFISIDINSIVARCTRNSNLTNYIKTPVEKEISESLKMTDLKELNITIKDKSYIIKKETLLKNKETANRLFELIEYGEKRVVKHGHKKMISITEKKRIERDNP